MIIVESKRKKPATILKKYPDAILADVTSGAKDGLVKLSPFYPHGGIPVPFSEGYNATCVEATAAYGQTVFMRIHPEHIRKGGRRW